MCAHHPLQWCRSDVSYCCGEVEAFVTSAELAKLPFLFVLLIVLRCAK